MILNFCRCFGRFGLALLLWFLLELLLGFFLLFLLHWLEELWSNNLGGAGDELSIIERSFDEPVSTDRAEIASINTLLAQVIVTTLTDGAVIVLIGDGGLAQVAVDHNRAAVRSCRGICR